MFNWLAEKFAVLGYLLVIGMAWAWAGVAGVKAFSKEPLLYTYYPDMAGETIPLVVISAVILLAVLSSILHKWVARVAGGSMILEVVAPKVFFIAAAVLVCWVLIGPHKQASFLPLAILVALSGWAWYAAKWGFLRFDAAEWQRVARGGPKEEPPSPARVSKPKVTFADIEGNEQIKVRLKEAALQITARRKEGVKPRNGILLHGAPGNGKDLFAEALAGELGLPFIQLAYADVASQWVGEKSARVRQAFEQATRQQPCLFFINEVDSFLESRDGGRGDGVKEDRDLVNAMLTLLVDLRQTRVVIVAATNHVDRLDSAGVREGRFDYKVEITPPDEPARIGLLRKGLRDNVPGVRVEARVLEAVARRWNGFSSKRILSVTEELQSFLKGKGAASVGYEDFMGALRQLQGQRGHVPENVKPLEELVFSPATREMLDQIMGRMADPEHTELHGGTLPTGVLFSGPPGTGKTAACKALAKAVGWAFLPATGADLARDAKKLEALYAKAQDLRPTIIFIDEADELMRSREYSPSTEATNRLLTLMDGVGDRVRDVVWIAATNHPDQIDAALMRGGRFTEKVRFEKPSAEDLGRHIARWLGARNVQLEPGLDGSTVSQLVGHESIANAEAVIQAALNRAVARRQMPVIVSREDVEVAVRLVLQDA